MTPTGEAVRYSVTAIRRLAKKGLESASPLRQRGPTRPETRNSFSTRTEQCSQAAVPGIWDYTSSAGAPTTTELPNNKDWSIHDDTTGPTIYLAFNLSGTIKKVALT
jgi:hypothetical protein